MELPITLRIAMRAVADGRWHDAEGLAQAQVRSDDRHQYDAHAWQFIDALHYMVRGVARMNHEEPTGPYLLWLRAAYRTLSDWPRDDAQLRAFGLKATYNLAIALMIASIPQRTGSLSHGQRSGLEEAITLLGTVADAARQDNDPYSLYMAESLTAECLLRLGRRAEAKEMAASTVWARMDLPDLPPGVLARERVLAHIKDEGTAFGCPRLVTAELLYRFQDMAD